LNLLLVSESSGGSWVGGCLHFLGDLRLASRPPGLQLAPPSAAAPASTREPKRGSLGMMFSSSPPGSGARLERWPYRERSVRPKDGISAFPILGWGPSTGGTFLQQDRQEPGRKRPSASQQQP
jgi:hypothetical protein